ncbi:hypothetical protein BHE74_00025879 [Ensete ventricosum]|uniref:Uncharacterized protein n=1 Tax=Ensete ventricosum TaxID=4639 RepID=A0A444FIE7_ENSVE|nr:hypothetical protein B296_00049916 [Ensete ventricosum]RWW22391.1 hypothetical protein GW17_00013426 [Ensete ventricosum]RWW66754.1 hypothetical protein BHE74_00025879 [Ensete ventricosum]RZR96777.1 hypothetical protein BHM03_00025841 [Ensete ventricosum]
MRIDPHCIRADPLPITPLVSIYNWLVVELRNVFDLRRGERYRTLNGAPPSYLPSSPSQPDRGGEGEKGSSK